MGYTHNFTAHTDLSIEAIQAILFDGIDIEEDPRDRRKLQGDGFYCTIGFLPTVDVDISENFLLDVPENLEVTFYFAWDFEKGFINAMKMVMNWFRQTTGDCAYLYSFEIIFIMRVNGKITRNSSEWAELPDEVIELIDIPHEVKDLGIL